MVDKDGKNEGKRWEEEEELKMDRGNIGLLLDGSRDTILMVDKHGKK